MEFSPYQSKMCRVCLAMQKGSYSPVRNGVHGKTIETGHRPKLRLLGVDEAGFPIRGHFDVWSAYRPYGRDLLEFFNSMGWALYGQMKSVRKHWPTSQY
jgi:hypothetical protein